MKRFLPILLAATLGAPLYLTPPSEAQFGGVVYDPANHVQNILQAVRALQEIQNQIQQITNEVRMLENMADDLTGLPNSIAQDIQNRINAIDQLMRQAQGIGYRVGEVDREYEIIYPRTYGTTPPPQSVLVSEARTRWEQSRSAYKQSLIVTAGVVENARTDHANLDTLITQSQSAIGNLQAVQAGNQIDALQTEQLMQIESMMAAHYRAQALERAKDLAEETRGRARLQSFLGN